MNNNTAFALSLIMLLTGIGIPVMAAMNGTVGARIGSPALASLFVFSGGLAVMVVATLVTRGQMGGVGGGWRAVPLPYWCGGLLMAFYVLSITTIGPRIGLGNAIFLVLLGQIVAATTIDHFGLFGAPRTPISLVRMGGIALMLLGIFLARKPPGI